MTETPTDRTAGGIQPALSIGGPLAADGARWSFDYRPGGDHLTLRVSAGAGSPAGSRPLEATLDRQALGELITWLERARRAL